MLALLTSCGRHDLLNRTIDSLFLNQQHDLKVIVHEDSDLIQYKYSNPNVTAINSGGKGQNKSIDKFLRGNKDKYYLHLEDDWLFNNTYDWIKRSVEIMEADPTIIKVICRSDAIHPCEFNNGYGILHEWEDPWKHNRWFGFGWNPGVTRLDLLKEFTPFPKWEQELSEEIHRAGYRVALLENGVCTHIGEGRSTHEN